MDPFGSRLGTKWLPKSQVFPKVTCKKVSRAHFLAFPILGRFRHQFVIDLWLIWDHFFADFGADVGRLWMIFGVKAQPFWNRLRSSIPHPPKRPNAKNTRPRITLKYQGLQRYVKNLLRSARNLPRISWSTIASTHLPHKHPPRYANEASDR